jgi:hypothetical protein
VPSTDFAASLGIPDIGSPLRTRLPLSPLAAPIT